VKVGILEVGSVVSVNGHGNIKMTVEKLSMSETEAHCIWFDAGGKLQRGSFDVRLLFQDYVGGFGE